MPDLSWRTLTERRHHRPFRLPVAIVWRLQKLRETVLLWLCAALVQAVARVRALRSMPRAVLVPAERFLILHKGARIFDGGFYLDQNADVKAAGVEPLAHYLRFGWQEARAPNPQFDDGYYRAEAGLAPTTPISALAHFLAFGARCGVAPAPDVDVDVWQKENPEIDVARVDPYGHLLRSQADSVRVSGPAEPSASLARIEALQPSRRKPPLVDVIMPVYRGRAETLSAIAHVLQAQCGVGFELIVVDDCTPDADLAADLEDLQALEYLTLLRQSENRGFVAAINLGMSLNCDRDVVWLNADTQVYDGWLDRLREAAYSAPKVATATPLSNNATLCSYPRIDTDNAADLEIDWAEVSKLAGRVNTGERVEVPTAVGFSTYVRRDAIEAIGMLDEAAFGRGYGEENDFSRRAVAQGWINLAATDVLVRHFGGVSFGAERGALIQQGLAVLDRRYPDYHAAVQRFLAEDPLRGVRHAMDLARLRTLRGERNVLMVTHARGGGTAQHVAEEIERLSADGASVFLLSKGSGGKATASLSHVRAGALPTLEGLALSEDRLWALLGTLNLTEVQLHHLIEFETDAARTFHDRLLAQSIPYSFTFHDYFAICPRINMVDLGGMYCGEPDATGCQRCLLRRGSVAGRPNITLWRDGYRTLLSDAEAVQVPDRDVADRVHAHFPELQNVTIRPHEAEIKVAPRLPGRRRPGPLRVAVIGAIGPIKGVDILFAAAMRAQRTQNGPEFTVIGYTHNDRAARACGIRVTGAYDNAGVDLLIDQVEPDVIWIPSIWPETYCYTLSIALRSGLPVAGFAIGAIATRLRDAGWGRLIPLSDAAQPERLLEALSLAADIPADVPEIEAA